MEQNLTVEALKLIKQQKRRRMWTKLLSFMACIVVFCTTYALILPAITKETDVFCGKDGHVHEEACYEEALICGFVDTPEDGSGASGHVHSADCYLTEKQLICQIPECEEHVHSDACKTYGTDLSCGMEESVGHTHGAECQVIEKTLNCTLPEDETHTHGDGCYSETVSIVCGLEETAGHTHDDSCYTSTESIVCGLQETEGHSHSEACYGMMERLICEVSSDTESSDGDQPHEHTDACYEKTLICEKEEHEHTLSCYSDSTADLESKSQWESTLPNELTGEYAEDVLAIAKSQLGYTESSRNYQVMEDGVSTKGYTRYGAWYGVPYGDWCAMFVSFCLSYAEVEDYPLDCYCPTWVTNLKKIDAFYTEADQDPAPGDIVFFDWDYDDISDHVGLVEEYIPETEHTGAQIKTIEGNSGNRVARNTYGLYDEDILGYGRLPVNEKLNEEVILPVITKTAVIYTDGTYQEVSEDPTLIELRGAIPEDVDVKAYPVTVESENRVVCAYDITIFLPDGTIFEPGEEEQVTVVIQSSAIPENAEESGTELEVYYLPEEGEPERVISTVTETGISFDTDHFSTYAVFALDDPYDLGNYITGETVERKGSEDIQWQPVENGVVNVGDSLRFDMKYLIKANVLDINNRVLTYDLPVEVVKGDSGIVFNDSGAIVGNYVITEDGQVTITFNEEYATSNGLGAEISGHIAFETMVEYIDWGDDGDVDLPFSETIHLEIQGQEMTTEDLQVTKKASNVNVTGGTVDYTIEVTSVNGTGGPIYLTDVLRDIDVNGSIVVKNNNGNTVNDVTITENDNGFDMVLPQLDAGGSYTITYSAKIPNAQNLNGTLDVNNKVKVTSTDRENGKLVDEDEVDTSFVRNVLQKSGSLSGDTITWTVVVNTSGIDISGWKLSDIMNGVAFTGNVTISPNPSTGSGSASIKLPYTFPNGSNKTYTITYATQVESGNIGNTNYNNTAVLEPDDGGRITEGEGITTVDYNPLNKENAGVTVVGQLGDGTKVAEFRWTVTIDASQSNIVPYAQNIGGQTYNAWYYGDEAWNEARHWITGAQLKALAQNLASNYSGEFTVIGYVWTGNGNKYQNPTPVSQMSDTDKFGQFRILFFETLPQGSKIQFQYSSTVPVGDGTDAVSVTNYSTVNGKVSDQVTQYYRPVATKVDKNGSGDTTEHLLGDTMLNGYPGVLGWNVDVTIPDIEHSNDIVIIEDIPDGTDLLTPSAGEWSLSFALGGFSNHNFNFNGGNTATLSSTYNGNRYTVTAQKLDGAYVVTVPGDLANAFAGKTIRLEVRVQIDDDFVWDEVYKSFVNKVIVNSGNTELGSTSQTQVIHNPIMVKASGTVGNNMIPYTLDINPGAQDLLPGTDTLTLTDVLEYLDPESGIVNATLLLDTVKVEKINSDGSTEDITTDCPFTFEEAELEGGVRKVIKMTLPDKYHLKVSYSYMVSGTIGAGVTIENSATLEGLGQNIDDDKDDVIVSVETSNAGATIVGVRIVKVDADNYQVKLDGCKFALEEWDGKEYVRIKLLEITENGTVSTGELKTNTAYRLVEVESPHGYELDPTPKYFYIPALEGELNAPEDFDGAQLSNGDSIIVPNLRTVYELPETGGAGKLPYTLGGLLLMATAAMAFLMYKLKPRRREEPDSS